MTIALILSLICLSISLPMTAISCVLAWRSVQKNFQLQDREAQYKRFNTMMLDVLEEDTQFMRSELIRRLSMELPDTKQVNSAIVKFQNNLTNIREALKQYKMSEDE